MNKDLMMRAAVQFNGVWPIDGDNALVYVPAHDKFYTAINFSIDVYICTREQFEDFVDSLFDGAPDNAEMYVEFHHTKIGYKGLAYKNKLGKYELMGSVTLISKVDVEIPRPAKKSELIPSMPTAHYMPKVGEVCEMKTDDLSDFYIVTVQAFSSDGKVVLTCDDHNYDYWFIDDTEFRPIKTERQKFIEMAAGDYLNQVGSDAVNQKWFGRIFGAMYDAGYVKKPS